MKKLALEYFVSCCSIKEWQHFKCGTSVALQKEDWHIFKHLSQILAAEYAVHNADS